MICLSLFFVIRGDGGRRGLPFRSSDPIYKYAPSILHKCRKRSGFLARHRASRDDTPRSTEKKNTQKYNVLIFMRLVGRVANRERESGKLPGNSSGMISRHSFGLYICHESSMKFHPKIVDFPRETKRKCGPKLGHPALIFMMIWGHSFISFCKFFDNAARRIRSVSLFRP